MDFLQITHRDLESATGYIEYFHNGKSENSSAFDITSSPGIRIILPAFVAASSVICEIHNESFTEKYSITAESAVLDERFDLFDFSLGTLSLGVGLYFFRFVISSPFATVYGYKNGRKIITDSSAVGEYLQFSLVNSSQYATGKFEGGIIYHVFVDRFCRAGNPPCRHDAVMRDDWDDGIPDYPEYPGAHLANNTFFGGTLEGVTEKLPYLKSLGITLIYLSPIFEAYSNHKYDTGDYMKVDEMFGGEQALKKLIESAAKLGIGIILDGVFNHTGADSIYFNRYGRYSSVGAYQSKASQYYGWYDFKSFPNDYTCWWGIEILPRINPDVRECGEFIAGDGGVIEKYAKLGIVGFRLDVADELSDEFLAKIKNKLREVNPESLLYGEVWEDASNKIAYGKRKKYYLGCELDAVMNYPLRTGILEYLGKKKTEALEYALSEVMLNAPLCSQNVMMNLLGTHDTERVITALCGESPEGKTNEQLSALKLSSEERERGESLVATAYTILATLPGLPTIYYGDEAGLEGYSDPFNRRPYPWKNVSENLLSHFIKIGNIRTEAEVYKKGAFRLLHLDSEFLAFARISKKCAYLTVVNNTDSQICLSLTSNAAALICNKKGREFMLKPHAAEIIKTTAQELINIKKV